LGDAVDVGRAIVVDDLSVADASMLDLLVVGAVDFDFDELLHAANTTASDSVTSASTRVVDGM
jgi:hypothetical protein